MVAGRACALGDGHRWLGDPRRDLVAPKERARDPSRVVATDSLMAPRMMLVGVPPGSARTRDFRRHLDGSNKDRRRRVRPRRPGAFEHRRPGYPLRGCVPAEPRSVSPGWYRASDGSRVEVFSARRARVPRGR